MQTLAAILLLSLFFCFGDAQTSNCPSEYAKLEPTHTLCLLDNPDATVLPVTAAQREEIITKHNEVRANVTDAADMLTLYWNATLAKTAEKWAKQCKFGHDGNRNEPAFPQQVGQNMATGWGSNSDYSFPDVIKSWASERKVWEYGKWTASAGHYIQEINSLTQYIGCGAAKCPVTKNGKVYDQKYLVCNYYPTTYSDSPPFVKGKPCDKCPGNCKNNSKGEPMCDCKSPICVNGGTDTTNCKCKCPQLWAGNDCSKKYCPSTTDKYYSWCATMDISICSSKAYQNACPLRCKHPHCQ